MSKIKEIKTTVYKWTGPIVPPAQNFCTNPTDLLRESEDKMKSFRFHKWLVCEVIDENGVIGIGNAALAPEVTKNPSSDLPVEEPSNDTGEPLDE